MTLRQAGEVLGLSRGRINDLIRAGELPSRLELSERGVAQRMVRRADVERLLNERREAAERQSGRGRPLKLPEGLES